MKYELGGLGKLKNNLKNNLENNNISILALRISFKINKDIVFY